MTSNREMDVSLLCEAHAVCYFDGNIKVVMGTAEKKQQKH